MIEPLTDREKEILVLISQGMSNQDIADTLYLSRGTIKAHNHNIYSKLGVTSRTQALLRAQELGLFDETSEHAVIVLDESDEEFSTLPVPLTPLIGRESELAKLENLMLDPRVRMVTIFGAGGMGKTQLALEVANRLQDHFSDGVYFIPLARVGEAHNIAMAIIDDMHMQFRATTSARQQLFGHFQNKQALLLLDNFEHLMDGTDFITELLQAAPHVKLLVTSRERLNLSTEVLFVLDGLDYRPDNQDSDAAKLIVQRARLVNPDFELTPENHEAVKQICQLTQGMPLAIVLACGWLEMLTLDEVAAEIRQSIDILETQLRDLPERQRSMRATIASSWGRLSPPEQSAFASLSVFRGGFTRNAAQKVASADLRSLQTLVNRSLVIARNGRYEVHELLRQYGLEELQRATHATELYSLHSAYYLDWVASVEADIKGRQQIAAVEDISIDIGNIRQAWHWAVQTGQFERVGRALEPLFVFFTILNRMQEGADLVQFTLDHLPQEQTALVNRLNIRLHFLKIYNHDLKVEDMERYIHVAQQLDDTFEVALATALLSSHLAYSKRDFERAMALDQQVFEWFESMGETFHLATVYHKHGYSQLQVNGMDKLIHYTEKAYEIAREAGNLHNMIGALGNLGSAALYLGRYHDAERYYRNNVPMSTAFGAQSGRAASINFSHILLLLGKFEEGERLLTSAWQAEREAIDTHSIAFGYTMYAYCLLLRGAYENALHNAERGLSGATHDVTGTLVAHQMLAMAYCGLNDTDKAEDHLREAWRGSQQMRFYASATWALPVLVITSVQRGLYEQAMIYDALLRTHPLSATAWLDGWRLLVDAEQTAKQALSDESFASAWAQGEALNLEEVVAEFVDK